MKHIKLFEDFINEGGLFTAANVIGNSVKVGDLEVAEYDLTEMYGSDLKWDKANSMVKKLGKGWRLPTKDELAEMYKNVNLLPNIKNNAFYMSSEKFGSKAVWVQNFGTGKQEYFTDGGQAYSVRPVKTI